MSVDLKTTIGFELSLFVEELYMYHVLLKKWTLGFASAPGTTGFPILGERGPGDASVFAFNEPQIIKADATKNNMDLTSRFILTTSFSQFTIGSLTVRALVVPGDIRLFRGGFS